ncbi:hypothetical protein jhhlp_008631 [Lomentospora prolificans]|uniref:NAD+ kinase n=1 Tax=Lomentospora prolificans TaxID=41688 RepID=A0A2N3MYL3_9PEZI|nr:hypothetical protein jhhlp_008631 [Lomentospora prolificans]
MAEVSDPDKHVAFDDDAHGSSSDEESHEHAEMESIHADAFPVNGCSSRQQVTKQQLNPVAQPQVTFDPAKTHRRKSSLDVVHVAMPSWKLPKKKTDCVVHQFLESQLSAQDSASSSAIQDDSASSSRMHSSLNASQTESDHYSPPAGHLETVQEVPSSPNDDEPSFPLDSTSSVHPKPRAFSTGNLGQPDQRAWADESLHQIVACDDFGSGSTPVATTPTNEVITSRLLTKKQLSEMAWGVRELSRRLSSIRLKPKVKSLFILTKIHDRDLIPMTRELTLWLLSAERERRYTVYVEDRLKDSKRFDAKGLIQSVCKEYAAKLGTDEAACFDKVNKQLRYWNTEVCVSKPHSIDFVITLGGDGTVLYASWLFQSIVPPVFSFSLGSLGFLTKFDFADYQSILTSAFLKGVTVSLRLRFEGTVMRAVKKKPSSDSSLVDGTEEELNMRRDLIEELIGEEKDDERTHRPDGTFEVLNEVVVDRGPNPTLSNLDLFGDDEHFTSILADGICVSTPTGSTAYNLAAGGSLCHPENPIMLVTSICPHTLSFRPIILPDTIVLRVGVPFDSRTSSWASFDGRERVELHPGDYVTISASRYPFATVQADGRRSEDWVNSISGKLGWNTRQKQKRYKEWDKKTG